MGTRPTLRCSNWRDRYLRRTNQSKERNEYAVCMLQRPYETQTFPNSIWPRAIARCLLSPEAKRPELALAWYRTGVRFGQANLRYNHYPQSKRQGLLLRRRLLLQKPMLMAIERIVHQAPAIHTRLPKGHLKRTSKSASARWQVAYQSHGGNLRNDGCLAKPESSRGDQSDV